MPGIKFQKFLGKAPRIAPELLPDMAAQTATNVKLYSGNLIPYPQPVVVGHEHPEAPGEADLRRPLGVLFADPAALDPQWKMLRVGGGNEDFILVRPDLLSKLKTLPKAE